MSRFIYCQYCGAMIIFERTVNNKKMPCDTPSVFYIPDRSGTDTILNEHGETVKGRIVGGRTDETLVGYVPHFATCTRYKKK